MPDRIIKLDTAILAKQKGFDQQPYRAAYNNYSAYYPEFSDGSGKIGLDHPLFNLDHVIAIAPTQTSLQTWLREVHQIDVFANSTRFTGYLEIAFYTFTVKGVTPTKNYRFETYEEALEAGLIIGLNQIEIKQKEDKFIQSNPLPDWNWDKSPCGEEI